MGYEDTYFSREERYFLGKETESDRYYAAFPVTLGFLDYNEYYELTHSQYENFMEDSVAALEFVEECRRREHDDLLLEKPGRNRGTPV